MIDFDATIVVQMLNFTIFLFILRKILFKPLVSHIQDRRNYLSSTEQKIAGALAKIEESERNYQVQLDQARQKAQDIINGNISRAEVEKQNIIKAAVDETRSVFDDFRKELEGETAKARENLSAEIESLSQEIAKKVLALNIPDEKLLVQGGNH